MTGQLLTDLVHGLTRGPFTTRKLVVMLVVVVVAGLGVSAYEIETASFALEKYAKAAGILKDLDTVSTSENTNIASVAEVLAGRVREILVETREDPSLSENEHRVALAWSWGCRGSSCQSSALSKRCAKSRTGNTVYSVACS